MSLISTGTSGLSLDILRLLAQRPDLTLQLEVTGKEIRQLFERKN